jgi:hypothetical protein
MTRAIALFSVAFGVIACTSTSPQPFDAPVIFVGSLQSETLFKEASCAPWGKSPAAHAEQGVSTTSTCIFIGCGFGEAQLNIEQVVAGSFGSKHGLLRYAIGEWCQPEFSDVTDRLLVCVYKADREHRFRLEPIYATENGDVILLQKIERIGDVDLASLLEPLPKRVRYGSVSELVADDLPRRSALGLGEIEGESVFATTGVFLEDLTRSLSGGRWKPRRVSVLVPDGLGGYVEIPGDSPTLVTAEPGQVEIWDC